MLKKTFILALSAAALIPLAGEASVATQEVRANDTAWFFGGGYSGYNGYYGNGYYGSGYGYYPYNYGYGSGGCSGCGSCGYSGCGSNSWY